jgi:glycosyltransferase involved in cell wall biosynthesis
MSDAITGSGAILIVSFSYWPTLNARAFRWTALAEDWASRGFDVHVVCALATGRPRFETVNGVQVHRAGAGLVEKARARLARARTAQTVTAGPGAAERPARSAGTAVRLVQFANRRVWRNLYWPDTTCLWYFDALATARAIVRKVRPQAVVSVSPTFTAVAVGRALLRGLAPAPRWLIDLGDPFSFAAEAPPNNFRLYGGLNARFERACFAAASAVSVTNGLTRDGYARRFPESAAKIAVIPPLLTVPPPDAGAPLPAGGRRLIFLGTLYPSIRRPDYLLALFRRLAPRPGCEDVTLHFYGDVRECAESFERHRDLLGSRVFVHGPVPRDEAAAAMRGAAVLVNIGNDTSYQLPSKIVEYAMTGKPILNLASVPDDSSSRFLADYPLHCTLHAAAAPSDEDVERTARLVTEGGTLPPAELSRWTEPFTLPRISAEYLALVAPGAQAEAA